MLLQTAQMSIPAPSIARAVPPQLTYSAFQSLVPSRKEQYRRRTLSGQYFTALTTQTQPVTFSLDKTPNTWVTPGTPCICGQVSFGGISAGTESNGTALIGSFYSMLRRQVTKAAGQPVETIDNLGVLIHHLTNNTADSSQSLSLSNMLGGTDMGTKYGPSAYSASIGSFGVVANNNMNSFSFCLPIFGALNQDKMLPLHSHGYEIELTFAPLSEFTRDLSGGANTTATSYTLSNLEIIAECCVTDEAATQQLLQMYPVIYLRAESWTYNAGTQLAASSGVGGYDMPLTSTLRGIKRILWSCAPADAIDKNFGSVNPNLANWQLIVGSRAFPTQPVEASRLAYVYLECQKATGSVNTSDHCGNLTRRTFASASTAFMGAGAYDSTATLTITPTYANVISTAICGNKHAPMLDLETLPFSNYMFNGVSSIGGSSYLRFNIMSPLAAVTHQTHIFVNYDLIIALDMHSGAATVTQ